MNFQGRKIQEMDMERIISDLRQFAPEGLIFEYISIKYNQPHKIYTAEDGNTYCFHPPKFLKHGNSFEYWLFWRRTWVFFSVESMFSNKVAIANKEVFPDAMSEELADVINSAVQSFLVFPIGPGKTYERVELI